MYNLSLDELNQVENLSVRTYNVCDFNDLHSVTDILKYYDENMNFLRLRNCGEKSNLELIEICKKYKEKIIQNIPVKTRKEPLTQIKILSLTQEEVLDKFIRNKSYTLSKRSVNAILAYSNNDLSFNGLKEIIINPYFDLNKIKNIGKKSIKELEVFFDIIKKKKDFILTPEKRSDDVEINNILKSLTTKHKFVLKNILNQKIKSLSQNDRLIFTSIENNIHSIAKIYNELQTYSHGGFDTSLTEKNEINELLIFFKEITKTFAAIDEKKLQKEYYSLFLQKEFGLNKELTNLLLKNYDINAGYPIFMTLDYLIKGDFIVDKQEKAVFFGLLNIFIDKPSNSLKTFQSNLGLSRERYRQIRNKLLKRLPSIINQLFTSELNNDSWNTYQFSYQQDFIHLSDDDITIINKNEFVNYNSYFITYIFSILFQKTHTLIGDVENTFFGKHSKTYHAWKSFYLIRNKLCSFFDFDGFINDVYRRYSLKINEDYTFHFQTYLLNFYSYNNLSKIDIIAEICENILFSEFQNIIDNEDNIVFKRNTFKQVYEYTSEALNDIGKPCKITKIYSRVKELNPNLKIDINSIKASLSRKNGFIAIGRNSVWGLKDWNEIYKFGSMHDIAEEFLIQFNEPKKIDEITEYVSQFRPEATTKNLLYNLKSAENRRFRFFKNSHIGLVDKQYDESFIGNNTKIIRRTWEENFELLSKFAKDNNRLPFSSGTKEELRLFRFMNNQINKGSKNQIDPNRLSLLNELKEKYNYIKRAKRSPKNIYSLYQELAQFINSNNRLPNTKHEDERYLYHFNYRQSKLFEKGELTPEQENMYSKIKELIQDIYGN